MALDSTMFILLTAGIFILVALVTFVVTFIFCLCCPFCIVPKLKKQRQGQINQTSVVNHDDNTRNNSTQQPREMIEVQNSNTPERLLTPHKPKRQNEQRQRLNNAPQQEPISSTSIQMTTLNVSNDPPPPYYPALSNEMDSENLPYNPNFSEDRNTHGSPTAPPPTPTPGKK